jgi:hypothetical protein
MSPAFHIISVLQNVQSKEPKVAAPQCEVHHINKASAIAPEIAPLQNQSDSYYGGYVAQYLNKKFPCKACMEGITTQDFLPEHTYTNLKEYDVTKNSLVYVTAEFSKMVGDSLRVISTNVKTNAHHHGLDEILKEIVLQEIPLDNLGCPEHKELFADELVKYLVIAGLNWYAKYLNKLIKWQATSAGRLQARVAKMNARQQVIRRAWKTLLRKKACMYAPIPRKNIQ